MGPSKLQTRSSRTALQAFRVHGSTTLHAWTQQAGRALRRHPTGQARSWSRQADSCHLQPALMELHTEASLPSLTGTCMKPHVSFLNRLSSRNASLPACTREGR